MTGKTKQRIKQVISMFVSAATAITMLPAIPAMAEDTAEKYPYTLFAGSSAAGAITVNAGNFCVNGSVATNGTIVSSGNMNINGAKLESANENMIFILNKLNSAYFTGDNVEVFPDDYSHEEMNININTPMDVKGELELTGNINLNTGIKALENVTLNGEVKNTNNSVVCSEMGDVIIDSQNVNLNGLVYAPFGSVEITAQNLNLNNVIIIADTIIFNCPSVNANYSSSMAEFIGTRDDDGTGDDNGTGGDNETGGDDETENVGEIELFAFGVYNREANSIELKWFTNYTEGNFQICVSDDNINYTPVAEVTASTEYTYALSDDFETRYFRIALTTNGGNVIEGVPFLVSKTSNGYVSELFDSDNDKLADVIELEYGTDPYKPDTDDDGLTDYQEAYLTSTNPLKYNSVTEALSDADADCDGDGLSNIDEITRGTNPLEADTDGDGLSDYDEVYACGTNPLIKDTDSDSLSDSDELKIGLDPTNPETFGIPDAQYKIAQTVSADSEAFSSINTADSPYKLSLEITAAGYVEGNILAGKSGYSAAVQNDFMLGADPELSYYKSESIESVKLIFEISEESTCNVLGKFTDSEELTGIKRLNIFKYFEEQNMLLPIETQFDIDRNIMYTEVDELGTYCVMDMEMWFDCLGVQAVEYESNDNEPMFMSAAAASDSDEIVPDETDTSFSLVEEPSDVGGRESDEIITSEYAVAYQSAATENIAVDTPVDVVFVLQTAGNNKAKYLAEKDVIRNVSDMLFATYKSARVCIISYNVSNAKILNTAISIDGAWNINSAAVSAALLTVGYKETNSKCNRGTAFKKMLYDISYRETSVKFGFCMHNGSSDVGTSYGGIWEVLLGNNYISQLNVCREMKINYSEIKPSGYSYINANYAQMVEKAIADTKGMILIIDDAETATMDVYDHIITHVAPQQVVFRAILPTDWNYVVLDSPLVENGSADTDNDGLTDWEEVKGDLIVLNNDGSVTLPTISDCIKLADKPYSIDGLTRYKDALRKNNCNVDEVLATTYILPIVSNPSEEDSDEDGLLDGTAKYNRLAITLIAPRDPEPLKTTGPAGLWEEHIHQMYDRSVPAKYAPDSGGFNFEIDKYITDFLVYVALSFKEVTNKYADTIRDIALALKNCTEGSTELGAYMLNFIYDNQNIAYHSQVDTWQRDFGYNEFYDDVFRICSFMDYGRVEFTSDESTYALWAWKGDYWNLQSGGEVGLYVRNKQLFEVFGYDHYDTVDFEVPMTLGVYNYYGRGEYESVFNWAPEINQWWITGFNPAFTEPDPEAMILVASVDLSGYPELFEAISDTDNKSAYFDNIRRQHFIFDEITKTVWIQWYNEGVA